MMALQSPTYNSWRGMIQRCCNPNHTHYNRYGGRGIKVCKRWRKSFKAFLEDMGERPEGLTLERKNNDKGYKRKNCKWATRAEQRSNQVIHNRKGEYCKRGIHPMLGRRRCLECQRKTYHVRKCNS